MGATLEKPRRLEGNQGHSSSHGGARKGAGRKVGGATAKTREIADRAAAEGLTPLEVMLKAMRHSIELFDQGKDLEHLSAAASFAKDAAPYIHPRLAAMEHSGPNGAAMQHDVTLIINGVKPAG